MASLTSYRTLGRTGLKISPLALGGMTFGWGADQSAARAIFDKYREQGGNFIDTADRYSKGASEEWLGSFVKDTGSRDAVVIATKFGFNGEPGNPNAGGNGRKHILRAVEGSLKRLQTDYIDLYFMHVYDLVTPAEEVITTLNDLVRAGKVRHIGFSDVPAWYVSRAQTIAELRGFEPVAALQLEYSLVARNLEREHAPLARELGIALMPWSPLASGFLSGKYRREGGRVVGQGRVADVQDSGNPVLERFGKRDQNWVILDALTKLAARLGRKPAEVALAWVVHQPQVTSVLIGATSVAQLEANLATLALELPSEVLAELAASSAPEPTELDHFFTPAMQNGVTGGTTVERVTR